MRSPYNEHAVSGLPNPSHLEREVLFVQAQDKQVTTRSPRIVTECLLGCLMLIKMYVHVQGIYSQFRAEAMTGNPSNCMNMIIYEPRHEKTCVCNMQTTKVQVSLRICAV